MNIWIVVPVLSIGSRKGCHPLELSAIEMEQQIESGLLRQLEEVIGYTFQDRSYLTTALMHASATDDRLKSNERLEFLGDAVLGLVVCDTLYDQFPEYLEGDLTKIKSSVVSRMSCAKVTRQMGLQDFLKVGKGMGSYRNLPRSLEAGLLEGVIGGIYLDGGLEPAREFILRAFGSMIENAHAKSPNGNYKSLLQQVAQDKYGVTPCYYLMDEKGPDHNKCFESEVVLGERHFPSAWGATKKEAEQKAAYNALVELDVLKHEDMHEDGYESSVN